MLRWLRSTLESADATARHDLAFFRTDGRFVAAIAVFLLVPALYAAIYLSSLWDPASLTRNLTVVLVNGDEGASFHERPVNVGQGLVDALARDTRFTYRLLREPALAVHEVDQGAAAFAVIIPPDFSRLAMAASQVGTARFVVHASEGNGSSGAGFAQRFAAEMSERLNQSINEQRFEAVLQMAGGSRQTLGVLDQAVAQLHEGGVQIAEGAHRTREAGQTLSAGLAQLEQAHGQLDPAARQLDAGTRQLVDGVGRAAQALRQLQAQLPPAGELESLRQGAQALAVGQQRLAAGLAPLASGAALLHDGHDGVLQQSASLPFLGESLGEAAQRLRSGSEQLAQGLDTARSQAERLADGARQLADGVQGLSVGATTWSQELARLEAGLPAAAAQDSLTAGGARVAGAAGRLQQGSAELSAGSRELLRGLGRVEEAAQRLRDGLQQLKGALPSAPRPPDGTAAGLSESVQPALQFSAPVANQGTAMTPYFAPLSLWVGATLCTVLFAYHLLPAPLQGRGRLGIVLGKLTVPAAIVSTQALVLAAVLLVALNVRVAHPAHFVTTLVLTGLTFAAMLFALVRLFGNAGKLVALILLAVQLSASGSMVPIELTSPFFQALHPWLPLTWAIKATRIAMFDAYEGAWVQSTLAMVAMLAGAVALAVLPRHWRLVEAAAYRPLVD